MDNAHEVAYCGFAHVDSTEQQMANAINRGYQLLSLKNISRTRKLHPLFGRGFDGTLLIDLESIHIKNTGESEKALKQCASDLVLGFDRIAKVGSKGTILLVITKWRDEPRETKVHRLKCHAFDVGNGMLATKLCMKIMEGMSLRNERNRLSQVLPEDDNYPEHGKIWGNESYSSPLGCDQLHNPYSPIKGRKRSDSQISRAFNDLEKVLTPGYYSERPLFFETEESEEVKLDSEEGGCDDVCHMCRRSHGRDDDGRWVTLKSCLHEYHLACVTRWKRLHNLCPLCYAPISTNRFAMNFVASVSINTPLHRLQDTVVRISRQIFAAHSTTKNPHHLLLRKDMLRFTFAEETQGQWKRTNAIRRVNSNLNGINQANNEERNGCEVHNITMFADELVRVDLVPDAHIVVVAFDANIDTSFEENDEENEPSGLSNGDTSNHDIGDDKDDEIGEATNVDEGSMAEILYLLGADLVNVSKGEESYYSRVLFLSWNSEEEARYFYHRLAKYNEKFPDTKCDIAVAPRLSFTSVRV